MMMNKTHRHRYCKEYFTLRLVKDAQSSSTGNDMLKQRTVAVKSDAGTAPARIISRWPKCVISGGGKRMQAVTLLSHGEYRAGIVCVSPRRHHSNKSASELRTIVNCESQSQPQLSADALVFIMAHSVNAVWPDAFLYWLVSFRNVAIGIGIVVATDSHDETRIQTTKFPPIMTSAAVPEELSTGSSPKNWQQIISLIHNNNISISYVDENICSQWPSWSGFEFRIDTKNFYYSLGPLSELQKVRKIVDPKVSC